MMCVNFLFFYFPVLDDGLVWLEERLERLEQFTSLLIRFASCFAFAGSLDFCWSLLFTVYDFGRYFWTTLWRLGWVWIALRVCTGFWTEKKRKNKMI
jgi:hypothetical protein